ncbi:MAG: methylenetetrahydrofolate--tRNA-(uracil(54)-C(5))-methyltransferase (FADH(2)-oxidizing) TrmFO [Anaerolineaceae bacterium]|nr:methylenetetrahydrofolate--tRNA-(uracil(54)-C(5))-methyltransferase (FADH(2)-oxidizing) TrmFO [Anaerolineaceae bacterium]
MVQHSEPLRELIVVGGGLAGSEAAWQVASRGIQVKLIEMRPTLQTGVHTTGLLAEIVCSNSLGSKLLDRANGLLQAEARELGSLLLECAQATALPAGGALAVDRVAFAELVTRKIEEHPGINIHRQEATELPDAPAIVASGPLTSSRLAAAIHQFSGQKHLFFYDAIAPIVNLESIDMSIAFYASRYQRGEKAEGDYLNLPLTEYEYTQFAEALRTAERIPLRPFEQEITDGVRAGSSEHFEGCLPIEVLANRHPTALSFGPMRPTGIRDPRTGKRPAAVVQLRQDNLAGSLYNLVGFQTNLTHADQKRVFRMLPGLERAEFERFGEMHRNTFIASPVLLQPTLQSRTRPDLFFAGQITGVEGYMGNIATGLLAGINAARYLTSLPPLEFPPTTMLGALCSYICHADLDHFQPMKANFGILPPLDNPTAKKAERNIQYAHRSLRDLHTLIQTHSLGVVS